MSQCPITKSSINNVSGNTIGHFVKGRQSGSYAPLDSAFENSPTMDDFERKLSSSNPILSDIHPRKKSPLHNKIHHIVSSGDCQDQCGLHQHPSLSQYS